MMMFMKSHNFYFSVVMLFANGRISKMRAHVATRDAGGRQNYEKLQK